MKVTIKTFESGAGDCIFLVMKDHEGSSYHIMVDCNVLTKDIKNYIHKDLANRIDLLIVTHIDSDHANGITKLLRLPEFKDLSIGSFLFNGFQPQIEQPQTLPLDTKNKLETAALLLPPTVDESFQKTNGLDAACLITELNKHPELKAVWRRKPILAREIIPLGENGKWGQLRFLSPTQKALDDLLHEVKLEYARRLSAAPPDGDFEDQDKYFELMLRLSELRNRPSVSRKTSSVAVTKDVLERLAATDANENGVTCANKASLAFCWEGGENHNRILMMGDAVSSQVVEELNNINEGKLCFKAIKVSHHGSKNNTSLGLNEIADSEHYFFTGGKVGEGPNLETIARIALRPVTPKVSKRVIHYNHEGGIPLWSDLREEAIKSLLSDYHLHLTSLNEYEFESN